MPLNPEAERMIEVFSSYLNSHFVEDGERVVVSRENYDEEGDPPKLICDTIWGRSYRIITLYADPFHDDAEGNILTGFFRVDGAEYDPAWELTTLIQYFDTDHSPILMNSMRTDAWPVNYRHEREA